jgi:hypothetical protein
MENDIETQKKGYLKLIDICVADSKRQYLISFISSLKNYNGDENFITTLNYVKDHLARNGIHFIMGFDWKEAIGELVSGVKLSLRDNFETTVELPDPTTYGVRASISYKNVFRDFDKALKTQDFKLGFIDTDADEYVIVVHKIKDENEIASAVGQIGYRYLDTNSSKINNEY